MECSITSFKSMCLVHVLCVYYAHASIYMYVCIWSSRRTAATNNLMVHAAVYTHIHFKIYTYLLTYMYLYICILYIPIEYSVWFGFAQGSKRMCAANIR